LKSRRKIDDERLHAGGMERVAGEIGGKRGNVETKIVEADWPLEGFDAAAEPRLRDASALVVVDGRITEILLQTEVRARFPAAHREGGKGVVAIPGLMNTHHHVGATRLQLGSPDDPLELWFAKRLALRVHR
jgi:5-methylthioadenosine/S-adenosylhomocysteine deaminase